MPKQHKTLTNWLARTGYSHEEAARKLGVPVRTFQDWLYGARRPGASGRALIRIKCG